MRSGRAGLWLVAVAPLVVLIAGCPSLDGFVGDGGTDVTTTDATDAASPSGGFVALSDAIAYCSKALTCANLAKSTVISLDLPIDGTNFAACVSWLTSTLPSDRVGVTKAQKALQCAAQATSCSAASACRWFEMIDPGDPRCVGYTGGSFGQCSPNLTSTLECNYDFIAHCDDPFNYSGSSCLKGNTGYYFCAVSSGLCSGDAGASATCSGSYNTYCQDGFLVGYDCEVQGMTCGKDPITQQYGCLSNGKSKTCNAAGTMTCAGTTVDVCDGITTSEINCGTLGATCSTAGNNVPRCVLPNETCSPYDASSNVCTGDVISLCIDGQPNSFDCSSAGMHCVAASGKVGAHCE
jgi:hypothetical protein